MSSIIRWLRIKVMAAILPEGSTPLPTGIVAALFVSMFGYAIAMQMLFAFLPDMIKSFGIADKDAGYYVGLVASAVFFGRLFSSYLWGWVSDKVGRRPVLLWCNFFLGITAVAFGFAKSLEAALVIRFITGLVAGIAVTAKASLTEICDDSNQALGMSLVQTAWNTGLIIGPAIGGYLAKPAAKYSVFKGNSFFEKFAYLLPCLVNAVINFLSIVLVFYILPETLPSKKKVEDEEMPSYSLVNPQVETSTSPQAFITSNRKRSSLKASLSQNDLPNGQLNNNSRIQKSLSKNTEMYLLSASMSSLPEIHLENYPGWDENDNKKQDEIDVATPGKAKPGVMRRVYELFKQTKLGKLCRNKNVRYCVGLYTVCSFAAIGEQEMYSLWAATGKEFGGLDFDTNDLGFTLMIVGAGCGVSNFIVFPKLVKAFGIVKTQYITLIITMFFSMILPTTNILYGRGAILKTTVIIVVLLIRVFGGCCFTGHFIMIGNSVTPNLRGTAHGFAMSVVCFSKAVSPTVSGSLFSWSITSGLGFPFNEKFVFIFLGFVVWLALVIACCLDKESVEKHSS